MSEEQQAFDRSVLFAIDGLTEHGKVPDFLRIHFHIAVGSRTPFRQVDRALQRLRRAGIIAYGRKTGWRRTQEKRP